MERKTVKKVISLDKYSEIDKLNDLKNNKTDDSQTMKEILIKILNSDSTQKKHLSILKHYGSDRTNKKLLAISLFEQAVARTYKSIDAIRLILEFTESNPEVAAKSTPFNKLIKVINEASKNNKIKLTTQSSEKDK